MGLFKALARRSQFLAQNFRRLSTAPPPCAPSAPRSRSTHPPVSGGRPLQRPHAPPDASARAVSININPPLLSSVRTTDGQTDRPAALHFHSISVSEAERHESAVLFVGHYHEPSLNSRNPSSVGPARARWRRRRQA